MLSPAASLKKQKHFMLSTQAICQLTGSKTIMYQIAAAVSTAGLFSC
jgi:hypothetical protein